MSCSTLDCFHPRPQCFSEGELERLVSIERNAMSNSADPVFESEQQHLKEVYSALVEAETELHSRIESIDARAAADKASMAEDIRPSFEGASDTLESYAAYGAVNSIIKQYDDEQRQNADKLKDIALLLERPYFAKLALKLPNSSSPREIYLGVVGFSDKDHGRLVYDWRSPVAEVYYSHALGKTTYEANGKTIEVDLSLRRQFSIDHDSLLAYFDTDIALQDDLLIESLSQTRSSHMKSITATIQREQNLVVRAPDAPAMLVSGVAGSGKTSVMLQRLAYLLYRNRDTLTPDNVVLMTPNSKFQDYIEEVLPELGEGNPNMHTWDSLLEEIAEGVTKNNESLTSRTILSRIEQEFAKDEPSSPFLKAECVRYVLIDEVQDYTIEQLEAIAAYYPRAHFLMLGDPNQALSDGLASFDEIRMLFAKLKGFVSEAHLSLSYRSTIGITRAFASLADPATDFCIESVLRDGPVPEVLECGCEEEYAHTLATVIEEITVGSAAIVALQRDEIEYFRSVVSALRMQGNVRADCEIEVLTLQEAKGLEFDHVILADVSSRSIESSDLWRRMLYTAVSRATRSLTALSRGQASSILKAAFRRCCESLG